MWINRPKSTSAAAIAQLGERQTEDLKVPGSIPGLGTWSVQSGQEAVLRAPIGRRHVPECVMLLRPESKLLSSPGAVPHTRTVLGGQLWWRTSAGRGPPKNAENCAQANGLRRVAMRFVCLRKATAGPPSSGKSNVCQPAVCASHPRRFPREHGVFPCSAAAAVASWSPGWPGARARVRPSAAVISKPRLCKAGGVRGERGEDVGKGGRQWGKGMRRGVLEPPPPDHPPTPNPPPRYIPLAC